MLFGEPVKVTYQANIEKRIDTSEILNLDYGSFKAVLIGAKDCRVPIATNIEGDKGCIGAGSPPDVTALPGTERTKNFSFFVFISVCLFLFW